MAYKSSIEWTETTWNPITGCTKITEGCANCYAEKMAKRLKAMGNPSYKNGFDLTLHENILERPLQWKKPRVIFVNSMSDMFHEDVSEEFIYRAFDIMNQADWHIFQVLTNRSTNMVKVLENYDLGENIWLGVTVENNKYGHRIKNLLKTNASVKFVSFEPLLSSIRDVDIQGIDWAIVGGESGPKARPMDEKWALEIKDKCEEFNIPFFFKQWGGVNKKKNGRKLLGRSWDNLPIKMRIPVAT